jgi:hypothetical protein
MSAQQKVHKLLDLNYDDNIDEVHSGAVQAEDLPMDTAVASVFTRAFPIIIKGSLEAAHGMHHTTFCFTTVDGQTFMLDYAPLAFYRMKYQKTALGKAQWEGMLDSCPDAHICRSSPAKDSATVQRKPQIGVPHIRLTANHFQEGNVALDGNSTRVPASTPRISVNKGTTVQDVVDFASQYLDGAGKAYVCNFAMIMKLNTAAQSSCHTFAVAAYRHLCEASDEDKRAMRPFEWILPLYSMVPHVLLSFLPIHITGFTSLDWVDREEYSIEVPETHKTNHGLTERNSVWDLSKRTSLYNAYHDHDECCEP